MLANPTITKYLRLFSYQIIDYIKNKNIDPETTNFNGYSIINMINFAISPSEILENKFRNLEPTYKRQLLDSCKK